ncbi:hypothetical protein PQ465_16150 [Sphingobacterium oryzagri]|uniref:LTXXQ motif family protein n=1 Tax=Sphingobacterium oryzagri TaxID=3025669 RepID=A0ABY7WDV6_9SPHI|nr:hypothetical protein [Sphingobacterium sp. KACC 22765]WDF67822.1 hypothetical protein PQ465_16150 [Sphingobacterium sp. KACC 22765]
MKKLASLAVLFAGISLATFAQEQKQGDRPVRKDRKHAAHERRMENRSPEEIAKVKTDRLGKELKFTDAQRKEVYSVQLEQAKRQVTHLADMKKLQDKWREEAKGSRQAMVKVLTPEQQELLKQKFAEGKREKGMRKPGALKGRQGDKVQERKEENATG